MFKNLGLTKIVRSDPRESGANDKMRKSISTWCAIIVTIGIFIVTIIYATGRGNGSLSTTVNRNTEIIKLLQESDKDQDKAISEMSGLVKNIDKNVTILLNNK